MKGVSSGLHYKGGQVMEDHSRDDAILDDALVLLIDSSENCRLAAASLIENSGRQCIGLGDNLEALAVLLENSPATIFIDRESGPLDLWQFCQLVRRHPSCKQALIIVLNKCDGVVERARAAAAGADATLLKPFASEELESVLGREQAAA
jgi:DNA-binding response OmpR family regulator